MLLFQSYSHFKKRNADISETKPNMKKCHCAKKFQNLILHLFRWSKKILKILNFFEKKILGDTLLKKNFSKRLKISIFVPFLAYYFIWPQKYSLECFSRGGHNDPPRRNCTILEPGEGRVNCLGVLVMERLNNGRMDICTSRVAFATEKRHGNDQKLGQKCQNLALLQTSISQARN